MPPEALAPLAAGGSANADSAVVPAGHFIAINGHRFHPPAQVLRCCLSVGRAVAAMDRTGPPVRVTLFVRDGLDLGPAALRRIGHLGIAVVPLPDVGNGAALNLQLTHARAAGAALFYRVDADDLVARQRFRTQAAVMAAGGHDILGGGLVYVSGGRAWRVVPPSGPGLADYLANAHSLHPTLVFRLAALDAAGLRYWHRRLEDKELVGRARRAGLRVGNDPRILGSYHHAPTARAGAAFAWLNLTLNARALRVAPLHWQLGLWPVALALFALSTVLPPAWLRRARVWSAGLRTPGVTRPAARMPETDGGQRPGQRSARNMCAGKGRPERPRAVCPAACSFRPGVAAGGAPAGTAP